MDYLTIVMEASRPLRVESCHIRMSNKNASMQQDTLIDLFIDLRQCLKIAHHIPGRLRLRASLSAATKNFQVSPDAIEKLLTSLDGVKDVRLNKLAGSATISYDRKKLHPDFWPALLTDDPDIVRTRLQDHFETS